MSKKSTIILVSVIAVVLILAIAVIGTYNGLAQGRESVLTARSDIDTQLQRRADLIPQLVATVKNLAAHEQSVVDAVTDAHAAMAGAGTTEERLEANDELTAAVNRLIVVAEAYPEITSTPAYITLMDELAGTENRIAVARKDYNEVVKKYNKKVISFPGSLFAGMFGFERADYYEATGSNLNTAPDVGDLFG